MAARPAGPDEGAVDVEEEEAHLGQCSPRSRQGQVAGRRAFWQSWGMVAIPEVRTLFERAAARRHVLEGLIASVPDDFWARRAADDDWTALDHVRHVATFEGIVIELADAARRPGEELWVGNAREAAALEARRIRLMEGVAEQGITELAATMRASREAAVEALAALPQAALDREVRIAGATAPLGAPHTFTVRACLAIWAEHDGEHEAAIRRAIETPPDLTALTLAARRARGSGRR